MSGSNRKAAGGFTLIELLIVVAIIAILAAIAVPNFLEAQVRSKVSRCLADFRALKTGMEAYRVDYNAYPMDYDDLGDGTPADRKDDFNTWRALTTPVAYVGAVFYSPFRIESAPGGHRGHHNPYGDQEVYVFWGRSPRIPLRFEETQSYFIVSAAGPDLDLDCGGSDVDIVGRTPLGLSWVYDPTNGTRSSGDTMMTAHGIVW